MDQTKRGKMIFIAGLIAIGSFLLKLFQVEEHTILQIYLIALGGFVLTYAGTLWFSNFILNKRVLLNIIPQGALFIFSEILFIELFFFSKFVRIYEAVLLFIFLIVFFASSYVTFLMMNIFIVSTVKTIPLEQVAKTTSFIISLLTAYFLTFGLLASGLNVFLIIALLAGFYGLVVYMHLSHLRLTAVFLRSGTVLTAFSMLVSTLGVFLVGNRYELVALVPTAVMFSCISIIINLVDKKLRFSHILEHILIFAATVLTNVFLN
ncbi:hypothetical protein GF357_04785 [Candidatus Dojkabacteria bacterium]|nr:hypothetical protein [Candidatus Dojkabacteria bacterium]